MGSREGEGERGGRGERVSRLYDLLTHLIGERLDKRVAGKH